MGCAHSKKVESPFNLDYKLKKRLGQGKFAVVHLATRLKDEAEVAVKIMNPKKYKSKEDREDLLRSVEAERALAGLLDHENVLRILEVYDVPPQTIVVMDYARGGELFDHLVERKRMTEGDCARVGRGLCSALEHLHSLNIVHRDIKPENVLFAEPPDPEKPLPAVKLCDFGFARKLPGPDDDEPMMTTCGTFGFMAPEIAAAQGYTSPKCDLWAVGVLLYECVSGRSPFRFAQSDSPLFDAKKAFSPETWSRPPWDFGHVTFEKVTDDCKELISGMMAYSPVDRLDASQALEHQWLSGVKKLHRKSSILLSDALDLLSGAESPSRRRKTMPEGGRVPSPSASRLGPSSQRGDVKSPKSQRSDEDSRSPGHLRLVISSPRQRSAREEGQPLSKSPLSNSPLANDNRRWPTETKPEQEGESIQIKVETI